MPPQLSLLTQPNSSTDLHSHAHTHVRTHVRTFQVRMLAAHASDLRSAASAKDAELLKLSTAARSAETRCATLSAQLADRCGWVVVVFVDRL